MKWKILVLLKNNKNSLIKYKMKQKLNMTKMIQNLIKIVLIINYYIKNKFFIKIFLKKKINILIIVY